VKKLIATAAVMCSLFGATTAQASTIRTVLPGDTLWQIGVEYRMPYDVIRRTNGLSSSTIAVRQHLTIPEKYVVKRGDSLWFISQRYGVSMDRLRYVNNEWDSALYVGQVLYLPTALRNMYWLSAADLDLFERLVSAESIGEPFAGQVAVANVVLNRVKSPDFPNTVREVILQYYGSIPAFSPVDDGQIYRPAGAKAKEAVQVALKGYDYSLGALFFYNPTLTDPDNWIRSRPLTKVIGNHLFAR
jgi:N-acetylmuramoyl-L-alanine amidase